jgi:fatty acid desaturase
VRPMTEPTRADAPRSRSLAVMAVPLLIVVVLLAVAYGMGYLEIGLILVVLLPFALPALTFYVWAKRRGDL